MGTAGENLRTGDADLHRSSYRRISPGPNNFRIGRRRFREQATRFALRRPRRERNHQAWYMSRKPRILNILYVLTRYTRRYSSGEPFWGMTVPKMEATARMMSRGMVKRTEARESQRDGQNGL